MKKLVKRYGNSLVITFNPEDCRIYGIVEGSIIDIEDLVVMDSEGIKVDQNVTDICKEMDKK